MLMEPVLEAACGSHDPHFRPAELHDRIAAPSGAGLTRDNSFVMPFREDAEAVFTMPDFARAPSRFAGSLPAIDRAPDVVPGFPVRLTPEHQRNACQPKELHQC